MITFNLERARKGVPVRTRNWVGAKLIAHLNGGEPAPIVVEVGGTTLESYYPNGRHNLYHNSDLDLFMEY